MYNTSFNFQQNELAIDHVWFDRDQLTITYVVPSEFVFDQLTFTVTYHQNDIVTILSSLGYDDSFDSYGFTTKVAANDRYIMCKASGGRNRITFKYTTIDDVVTSITINDDRTFRLFGQWLTERMFDIPFAIHDRQASLNHDRLEFAYYGNNGSFSATDVKSIITFVDRRDCSDRFTFDVGFGANLELYWDTQRDRDQLIVLEYTKDSVTRRVKFVYEQFITQYRDKLIDFVNYADQSN